MFAGSSPTLKSNPCKESATKRSTEHWPFHIYFAKIEIKQSLYISIYIDRTALFVSIPVRDLFVRVYTIYLFIDNTIRAFINSILEYSSEHLTIVGYDVHSSQTSQERSLERRRDCPENQPGNPRTTPIILYNNPRRGDVCFDKVVIKYRNKIRLVLPLKFPHQFRFRGKSQPASAHPSTTAHHRHSKPRQGRQTAPGNRQPRGG